MEERLSRSFLLISVTLLICIRRLATQGLSPPTSTPGVWTERPFGGPTLGACIFEKHTSELAEKIVKQLTPLVGRRYSTQDDAVDGWLFSVGICVTGDEDYESIDRNSQYPYKTAGALQLSKADKNKPDYKPHIIGHLHNAEVMAGDDWLMLEYEFGDPYGHHCGQEGKRTIVMITCVPGEKIGHFRLIEENKDKAADCYYLFELEHEAVCAEVEQGLSVGSIVCIVFISLVCVYLIGGFIYQRFVVGAKGMEQIPHVAFWQDLGNLEADGCDLICRCGSRPTGSRQYRGIGDEQITGPGHGLEEEEEGTDDHLLPM